MYGIHMSINLPIRVKRRQALPAHVRLASRAMHVVAPLAPLDRRMASRALLHVMALHPAVEQLLLGLRVGARRALVVLNVAVTAYTHEARGALQCRVGR